MGFSDISEYYKGDLAVAEENAWNATKEYKRNLAQVERVIKERGVKRIVEVGCGSGLIPVELPREVRYLGIDKNPTFLEYAKKKNDPSCRTFVYEDVRNLSPEWMKKKGFAPFDLVMSFAFFKHFGLHELDDVMNKVISLAPVAVFEVQTASQSFDNGTQFHHNFITTNRLHRVIGEAGHKFLYDVVVYDGDIPEGRMQARIIVTEKA